MLTWLARKLKHRLHLKDVEPFLPLMTDEAVAAELGRRFSQEQVIDALMARADFKGFIAWRRKEEGGEEVWGWAAAGLNREEATFQLEQAIEQVVQAIPGREA